MRAALKIGCISAIAGILVFYLFRAHTPPFRDSSGRLVPSSIASLEKVTLGGIEQYILIRGIDKSNPVLLFLHGGPGMPMMYLAHEFQEPLEQNFVVVQWDRRGAGKSYNPRIPPSSISVQQEISDTRDLVNLLRQRFQKPKIYLVGHSYGTYLGILVVRQYPELFQAYVAIGQVACDEVREHQIQDRWVYGQALAQSNQEALRQLEGREPLDREKWLFEFGGELHHHRSWLTLFWAGLTSPEYSLVDVFKVKAGVDFTAKNLKYNVIQGVLINEVPAVQVPVYFFTGRYDYADPVPCTEEYFKSLQAPAKKMVWFDDSAHFPFLEEYQKFANEMKGVAAISK